MFGSQESQGGDQGSASERFSVCERNGSEKGDVQTLKVRPTLMGVEIGPRNSISTSHQAMMLMLNFFLFIPL